MFLGSKRSNLVPGLCFKQNAVTWNSGVVKDPKYKTRSTIQKQITNTHKIKESRLGYVCTSTRLTSQRTTEGTRVTFFFKNVFPYVTTQPRYENTYRNQQQNLLQSSEEDCNFTEPKN